MDEGQHPGGGAVDQLALAIEINAEIGDFGEFDEEALNLRIYELLMTPALFDAMAHAELFALARALDAELEPEYGSPEWVKRVAAQLVHEWRRLFDQKMFHERMARQNPPVILREIPSEEIECEKELTAFFRRIDEETGYQTEYNLCQMSRNHFGFDGCVTGYMRERMQREENARAAEPPPPREIHARTWQQQESEEWREQMRKQMRATQSPPAGGGVEQVAPVAKTRHAGVTSDPWDRVLKDFQSTKSITGRK